MKETTASKAGSSVTLTPTQKSSGFVRKGKALVFIVEGGHTLDDEVVNDLIENLRKERHKQNLGQIEKLNRLG